MAIEHLKPLVQSVDMARSRFLYGIDRVPDDRLGWSPGGAAKTPLQLAEKMGGFLHYIAFLIQNRTMMDRTLTPPAAPAHREEAKARVDAAFAQLLQAVDGVREADLQQPVPVPWGTAPLETVLWWVMGIIGYIQGQLNYVQMAYGDEDPNIPPDWRPRVA